MHTYAFNFQSTHLIMFVGRLAWSFISADNHCMLNSLIWFETKEKPLDVMSFSRFWVQNFYSPLKFFVQFCFFFIWLMVKGDRRVMTYEVHRCLNGRTRSGNTSIYFLSIDNCGSQIGTKKVLNNPLLSPQITISSSLITNEPSLIGGKTSEVG